MKNRPGISDVMVLKFHSAAACLQSRKLIKIFLTFLRWQKEFLYISNKISMLCILSDFLYYMDAASLVDAIFLMSSTAYITLRFTQLNPCAEEIRINLRMLQRVVANGPQHNFFLPFWKGIWFCDTKTCSCFEVTSGFLDTWRCHRNWIFDTQVYSNFKS